MEASLASAAPNYGTDSVWLSKGDFLSASSVLPELDEETASSQSSSCMARCYRLCVAGSPDLAPLPWAVLNFLCLFWSTLLVFAIYQTEGPLERVQGTRFYLTWNLITTFIWCFEIGLIVLHRRSKSTIIHWMELVIAVYFFQDSITLMNLVFRLEPDEDIAGELADAIFSSLAYLYQFVDSLYLYSQRHRHNLNEPAESLSDALMHYHRHDSNNAEDF